MPGRLSGTQAVLYGTLVVGTLDALDAIVFFGLRSGAQPIRIFQGIASGLLGPAARQGGLQTAAIGVGLHYFIAFEHWRQTHARLSRELRDQPYVIRPKLPTDE